MGLKALNVSIVSIPFKNECADVFVGVCADGAVRSTRSLQNDDFPNQE